MYPDDTQIDVCGWIDEWMVEDVHPVHPYIYICVMTARMNLFPSTLLSILRKTDLDKARQDVSEYIIKLK